MSKNKHSSVKMMKRKMVKFYKEVPTGRVEGRGYRRKVFPCCGSCARVVCNEYRCTGIEGKCSECKVFYCERYVPERGLREPRYHVSTAELRKIFPEGKVWNERDIVERMRDRGFPDRAIAKMVSELTYEKIWKFLAYRDGMRWYCWMEDFMRYCK